VETVVLLTQKRKGGFSVEVEIPIEADVNKSYKKEEKSTYTNIKKYVKDKHGVNVHTSYIAQVKRMYGIDMRECFRKSMNDEYEAKQCPPEKIEYIKEALQHFHLI
jgi:hypothetical protein